MPHSQKGPGTLEYAVTPRPTISKWAIACIIAGAWTIGVSWMLLDTVTPNKLDEHWEVAFTPPMCTLIAAGIARWRIHQSKGASRGGHLVIIGLSLAVIALGWLLFSWMTRLY